MAVPNTAFRAPFFSKRMKKLDLIQVDTTIRRKSQGAGNKKQMTRRDSFQHVNEMIYDEKTGQYHLEKMHVVRSPVRKTLEEEFDTISSDSLLPSVRPASMNKRNEYHKGTLGQNRGRGGSISSYSELNGGRSGSYLDRSICKEKLYMQWFKCKHTCSSLFLHIDRSWFFLMVLGLSTTTF